MSSDLEHLLAHSGWIRGLARHLARDGQTADDLVQDAWVVALRHGPGDGSGEPTALRRWAASVLRNLARQKRRGDGRRAAHEERAARPLELPADGLPDALVERLDEQEALAAAVRALDEPYRAAILLRYYEGLSPAEIATRTGTPLRTVHTRLNRALHKLRAKLEPRGGPTWSILALPWIGALRESSPAALLGGLLVKTKIEIALVCAAVVGIATLGVWWVQKPIEPVAELATAPAMADELELPAREDALEAATTPTAERTALTIVPEPSEPEAAIEASPFDWVLGQVIDVHGDPVAAVDVAFDASDGGRRVVTTTDGQGGFAFSQTLAEGALTIASEGWATVLGPMLLATYDAEPLVLVVAPARNLAGTAVDPEGVPISGARVELELQRNDLRASLPHELELSADLLWRTTSDEHGRFDLAGAPDIVGSRLVGSKPGFLDSSLDIPSEPAHDLALVLEHAAEGGLIRGIVVDPAGAPIHGAHVGLGTSSARTDEHGVFTLDHPTIAVHRDGTHTVPDRMWAIATGHMPASVQRTGGAVFEEGGWPDPLRIVVPDVEPLRITGRVVDTDGEPLAGVRVWSEDRTPFGSVVVETGTIPRVSIESLAAGSGAPSLVVTGDDGAFALTGLLERGYRLSALDDARLLFARTDPIAAGASGVDLRMPAGEEPLSVAGRVVGLDGTPLADVVVIPERAIALPDGKIKWIEGRKALRTDGEGRFAIEGLRAAPDRLDLRGSAIFEVPGAAIHDSATWNIPATADLAELEITVVRRRRLQVELGEPGAATGFQVLDEQGNELHLITHRGDIAYGSKTKYLSDGRSEVTSLSELGRTLVLLGPAGEVRRVPIEGPLAELLVVR